MKNIKEGIKILENLEPGYYTYLSEIDRLSYSSPKTNILEQYVFLKTANSVYKYLIIGSDEVYTTEEMLENSYGEFSPLFNITLINKPVETTNEQPKINKIIDNNNGLDVTLLLSDNSNKNIKIYEYNGSFKSKDIYILYGHEEIVVLDEFGNIISRKYTR